MNQRRGVSVWESRSGVECQGGGRHGGGRQHGARGRETISASAHIRKRAWSGGRQGYLSTNESKCSVATASSGTAGSRPVVQNRPDRELSHALWGNRDSSLPLSFPRAWFLSSTEHCAPWSVGYTIGTQDAASHLWILNFRALVSLPCFRATHPARRHAVTLSRTPVTMEKDVKWTKMDQETQQKQTGKKYQNSPYHAMPIDFRSLGPVG